MISLFAKSKTTEASKPLGEFRSNVQLYMRMSSTTDDSEYEKIETRNASNQSEYKLIYKYWEQNNRARSVRNYNDDYFQNILSNKEDYLPYIYDDLLHGNVSLTRVLERIFPNICPYKGYISLELAREKWLRILKQQKGL